MQSTYRGSADEVAPGGGAWQALAGAATREQQAAGWLVALCGMIPEARAGLLLYGDAEGGYAPSAIWPDGSDLQHLGGVAQESLMQRRGVVDRAEPEAVRCAYPLEAGGELFGAIVLELHRPDDSGVTHAMRMVHWGAGWLMDTHSREAASTHVERLARASFVFETSMAAMAEENLATAALTAVNRIAQRLGCHRVRLGMEDGKNIRIVAVSHSAWFDARTNEMSLAAQAMNEAYDQRASTRFPAGPESAGVVSVALARYAAESGGIHMLAMPVENGTKVTAVWLLERDEAFLPEHLEALEAVSLALAGVLDLKEAADESLIAHARRSAKRLAMRLTDASYPGAKLAVAVVAVILLVLGFVPVDFRVPSRALVEGAVQRVAAAPFQGYIREAPARAGDVVKAGQTLAVLDDKDLRLERVRWESELEVAQRKSSEGMAKADRVAVRLATAQADQARAQLDLVMEKLARVRISAPFDGVVVRGDLTQELGSPVEQGKVLFEIAPLDSWRVILKVDERDIAFVAAGARGDIVLTSLPGQSFGFKVRQVTSVSTAEEGRNYFRVEAGVPEGAPKLRPGMEGVAKIEAGQRSLLWIWTRRLIDWIRLAIWEYTP